MNELLSYTFDEQLGYAVDEQPEPRQTSERRGIAAKRQLNGQERKSLQARYSRQAAPQRNSGAHRRRDKRSNW